MRRYPASILPLIVLLAACGGPAPEAKDPSAASSAAPSAEPAANAAPAAPEPSAKAAHDTDGPDGVRRWARWEGSKSGTAIATKRAWVIAPNTSSAGSDKLSFSSLALQVVDVEKSDATEVIYSLRKQKYATPAALAWAAEAPKGLKKGDGVLCAWGGSSVVARVEAADAKSVTCAFRFMEKTRKEKIPAADVRRLDGKAGPGAPAIMRFESDRTSSYLGSVVAASGDEVWVQLATQLSEGDARAGRTVHKVKASNVEVIDPAKALKVGDACQATDIASVAPCKVTKVIDGGLAYVVDFEGGSAGARKEWTLDEVAPAAQK